MRKRMILIMILSVALSALLSGCEAEPEGEVSRCRNVSSAVIESAAQGINTDDVTIKSHNAIKSDDFDDVFFVAVELDGPGLEGDGDIAVLSTNNSNEPGTFMAVNSVAQEFFDFPAGDSTDAKVTMSDDGAKQAEECLS